MKTFPHTLAATHLQLGSPESLHSLWLWILSQSNS